MVGIVHICTIVAVVGMQIVDVHIVLIVMLVNIVKIMTNLFAHIKNLFNFAPMDIEFNIDTEVTIDRYNAIETPDKGIVVGHDISMGGTRLYKVKINQLIITTSGMCIRESKFYEAPPKNERFFW